MINLSVKYFTVISIVIFIILFLTIALALSPGVISNSNEIQDGKNYNSNPDVEPSYYHVYVGDLYIEGTGDHETSLVMANAENDLRIKVGPGGEDIVFEAKYLLQCPGLFDAGFASLWVQGGLQMDIETYDYAEGYLYSTVYNCKVGDYIYWTIYAVYDDLLFPYPLTAYDSGGGRCTLRSRSVTSNPLFLQILERLMDKLPILNQIINQLTQNIVVLKGTIICE